MDLYILIGVDNEGFPRLLNAERASNPKGAAKKLVGFTSGPIKLTDHLLMLKYGDSPGGKNKLTQYHLDFDTIAEEVPNA